MVPSPSSEVQTEEEAFAMDSDAGHVVSIADLPTKSDRSVLDSRWPPFPRAVQVLSPKHLIDAQAELVRNLCSAIPLSDEEVEQYLMPVIWNLACFVHLLPASAHHHHRGLGGLFGHSLETAIFAAQTAKNKIFDFKARPEDAFMNKGRWILACALAGLTHDVGKAVLDIRVYSDQGTWHPTSGSITEWCKAKGISAYYVAMNEDRTHNKHEQASLAYARVLIPRRTYCYLSQTGNSKIEEELHAAISGQHEGCLVGEILGEADQLSVKLDERRQGSIDPRDKLVTTPLADAIVKAMRTLIKEGTWTINTQKAHLWLTTQGCFIDWSDVSDITKVLAAENVKSVPHDNGAMASMLLTEGLIEAASRTVSPDERFWSVCPFLLRDRTVTCVKFRVPVRLIGSVTAYSPMPVYLPNLPMLEADVEAWLSGYGFDPSAQEHEQVEDEDYLDQLIDSVAANPGAYQTPNVGFYMSDAEELPSITSLLPPDEAMDEPYDEADWAFGQSSADITELENQLLQSDFCQEDDASTAMADLTTQDSAVSKEGQSDESQRDFPASTAEPLVVTSDVKDKTSAESRSSSDERRKQSSTTVVTVEATPCLTVKKDIVSAKVSNTDTHGTNVRSDEVDIPEAPPEYATLDVSEASFARLLPGGTRKKGRQQKEKTFEEHVSRSAMSESVATLQQETSQATPCAPFSVDGTAEQSSSIEEDEFGGLVFDEGEVVDQPFDSTPMDVDGGFDLAIVVEDDELEDDDDASERDDVCPTSSSVASPYARAKGKAIESTETFNDIPRQEEVTPERIDKKDEPSNGAQMPTVALIATKCGNNHRQAAQELITEMKRQMQHRRGDLLSSQVWKNVVGYVTDDKAFVAAMSGLAIPVPLMAMALMKYQPLPKLEWDREAGKVHLKIAKASEASAQSE